MSKSLHGVVRVAAVVLSGVSSLSFAASADRAAPGPWPTYNNGYDEQRFSFAKKITPANLKRVCESHLGDVGAFHSGILVIGKTIYVTTAHTTAALDATNCSIRWRHVYKPEQDEVYAVNRGLAYLDGTVFGGTGDARILALDAHSGKVLWLVKAGDPLIGEFLPMPKLYPVPLSDQDIADVAGFVESLK